MVVTMGPSTLRIILLVTLGLLTLAMIIFICLCFCRTHRRLHRNDPQSAPLLDNESSLGQSEYGTAPGTEPLDYNATLERTRIMYQPTPFTQAQVQSPPPRYDDLYGSISQPYNNFPSFLLDDG